MTPYLLFKMLHARVFSIWIDRRDNMHIPHAGRRMLKIDGLFKKCDVSMQNSANLLL